MPKLTGLIPELATLAQSAEQTLRKRQVKGSSPLGGLINIGRPQQFAVGAFAVSSTYLLSMAEGARIVTDLFQDAGEPPRF